MTYLDSAWWLVRLPRPWGHDQATTISIATTASLELQAEQRGCEGKHNHRCCIRLHWWVGRRARRRLRRRLRRRRRHGGRHNCQRRRRLSRRVVADKLADGRDTQENEYDGNGNCDGRGRYVRALPCTPD